MTSNKDGLEVTRLDYVDDHDVKLFSNRYHIHGQRSVQVPIIHTSLTDIWNRKGGNYYLTLRVTMTVAAEVIERKLPVFIEQRIRGNTAYIHVSG